jgi:hypothetical protein
MHSHTYFYLSALLLSVFVPVVSCFDLIARSPFAPFPSQRLIKPVLAALSSSSDDSSQSVSTSLTATIQKYGTPVGVVILLDKDIQPFHEACQEALPHLKRIYFRGVDPHIKGSGFKQVSVRIRVRDGVRFGVSVRIRDRVRVRNRVKTLTLSLILTDRYMFKQK